MDNNKDKDGGNNGEPQRRTGVDHNYHDYASVSASQANLMFPSNNLGSLRQHNPLASSAQQQGFAVKLHFMLSDIENSGEGAIVSWQPHGRCFVVHDRKAFVDRVLPNYFLQSTFASFQRQLNLYGFKRISSSQDKGGYYHELFLRSKQELASYIQRIKRKGNGPRKPDSPDSEPNFYAMSYLPRHPSRYNIAAIGPFTRTPCFLQDQMTKFDKRDEKPSAVQMLSLKSLLPATMAPPPLAAPALPPFGHFLQPQPMCPPPPHVPRVSGEGASQMTPAPAPQFYSVYMNAWNQSQTGAHGVVAIAPVPPSAPNTTSQYQGGFTMPSRSSDGTAGSAGGAPPGQGTSCNNYSPPSHVSDRAIYYEPRSGGNGSSAYYPRAGDGATRGAYGQGPSSNNCEIVPVASAAISYQPRRSSSSARGRAKESTARLPQAPSSNQRHSWIAGYSEGRPMPPMPLVAAPPAVKANPRKQDCFPPGPNSMSPCSSSRKGQFVPLPYHDPFAPSETKLVRSNSGSLTPTSWHSAFGEDEDLWGKATLPVDFVVGQVEDLL